MIWKLVLVVATVLALAVPVSASPPIATPPDIERITFVHYQSGYSKPVWDDTEDDFRLIAGGVKWSATVSYGVNTVGSGLEQESVRSTLETSLETWDAQTSFELFAPPITTPDTVIGYDGINRVIWAALDPGVIAVNYVWYIPRTKEIVESDVIFNSNYVWSTTGASNAMDLQNIATHEFGHNGLGDLRSPKDQALTMYAYSNFGETEKQTLGNGDILGIQKLYNTP